MKLPHAEAAMIDISKLRDYCLDPDHPRGKHKARVFRSALGFTQDDAEELKEQIANGIRTADCLVGDEDLHGRRYIVDLEINYSSSSAQIRTSWIIKNDEEFPRLTSCYVRE